MKHWYILPALCVLGIAAVAQTDSSNKATVDTIRIGSMIIIKKNDGSGQHGSNTDTQVRWQSSRKPKRLTTSWLTLDFGYSNFTDKTNFASAAAREYARTIAPGEPPFTGSDFNIRNGKSFNINVWLFRQHWGITRDRKFNLSYGLMLETNNYRYENPISYVKGTRPYVFRDNISFNKNKLATSYFTLPVMLGYSSKPGRANSFHIAGGVSVGYLYSSRNKQKSDARGKDKLKGDFDLETWKFQYVGEIGLGPVKVYASVAPTSMYERGLDMRPYNVGLRFGGWN
jgi:hypothetical protein